MWLFEVVPEEIETITEYIPPIVELIHNVVEMLTNTVSNVVDIFRNVPNMLNIIGVYFGLIPPFIKPFIVCGISFIVFRFGYSYSKGSGQ